jgi:hypothetical protein
MKPISERADELFIAARDKDYDGIRNIDALRMALDEWQTSVEKRLASLCEARAKECHHFEFMGGCWKDTSERVCGTACNCDCHRHRCAGARMPIFEMGSGELLGHVGPTESRCQPEPEPESE